MRSTDRGTRYLIPLATLAGLALSPAALATNGYFTHGYGTCSKGLGGAGVALPLETLSIATNPASAAVVGERFDAGLALFNPNRRYTVTGTPSGYPGTFGLAPGTVESGSDLFEVPYVGANWRAGAGVAGLAVYAHGGMNTDYPAATFYGSSSTGVDLSQLFIAPTYARTFGAERRHSLGISPLFVFQRFEVRGLAAFAPYSSDPSCLSNNHHDESWGYGAKVGYLGRLGDRLTVGLSYQSKVTMDALDDYAGLFAGGGDFDIPSTATAGIAVKVTQPLTWVFDVQQIAYSDVDAVASPLFPNLAQAPLGAAGGPGFGWEDMTIYKTGLQARAGRTWMWRVGFSLTDQPIPASEVLFNILAPGVTEKHATVGFTKLLSESRSVNFALMHGFAGRVTGANPLEAPGAQQIELEMDQWDVEVSYSWGYRP